MKDNQIKRGSMTVEIACVMSLILLVLLGVLYLCFFVHNRSWLTSAAYEAALSGSMEGCRENGKITQTAEVKSKELGNTGFFGAENLGVDIKADEKKVEVSYELDTIASYGGLKWHLKTKGISKVIRPVEWIRKIKAAANLVKGGAGEG